MEDEKQRVISALNKYFEDSDVVTAQHQLFNEFDRVYKLGANKFQMYLLFAEGWGHPTGKAECGSFGYYKKVKLIEK